MNPIDWLGRWEPLDAPGRHSKVSEALFAHGYQWRPVRAHFESNRAICPQAQYWLEKEKPTLRERIIKWLKEAA